MAKITKVNVPQNVESTKEELRYLKKFLRMRENVNWPRDQKLHNMAYSLCDRLIEKEMEDLNNRTVIFIDDEIDKMASMTNDFPEIDDVVDIDYDEMDLSTMRGCSYAINNIYDWKPNKALGSWSNLEKEMVHIFQVKRKIVIEFMIKVYEKRLQILSNHKKK